MQIKIYLLLIITLISINTLAQELFPKKELYHIWIVAGEKLDAGLFDDVLRLYSSHADNPNFGMKIRQVSGLKEIAAEADKLKRRGKYAEAVDKYKEYRKFKNMGTLGVFEKKIDDCLNQINKGKIDELTAQQRIITGFEFAHRGRQKLSKLDTAGARRDFSNAKILGGNRNNTLKEQYVEGIRVTNELTTWGKINLRSKVADQTKNQELAALESYRNIRNLDIPDLESKIKELKTELDGINSLPDVAKLCDTELLIRYVNKNKSTVSTSGFLLSRLNEFLSTQKKISILRQDITNVETVKSAYASLFSWMDELPLEIREEMRKCVQTEYSEFVASLLSSPKTEANRPVPTKSCNGQEDFDKGLTLIRKELTNCNTMRAIELWKINISYLQNCDDREAILVKCRNLSDSLLMMVRSDSISQIYRSEILKLIQSGDCSKTAKLYEQMKKLKVCNQSDLNVEVQIGIAKTKDCKKRTWWKPELTGSAGMIIPKYSIGGTDKKMSNNGWIGSGGIQLSFIDHKNPVDFTIGVEYFKTNYYSIDTQQSVLEDFKLSGASGILAIKFHQANTNPKKIRPYLKLGSNILIPISYDYKDYSDYTTVCGTDQLQKTILSVNGGLGLEIQKKNFGAFLEAYVNYGLGSIYNSKVSHMTSTNQDIEAKLIQLGIRIGLRLW